MTVVRVLCDFLRKIKQKYALVLSRSRGELAVVEVVVEATLCQKLIVRALLNDLSALHHQDAVGTLNGGEAMRHDKGCAPLHHFGKGTLNFEFHTRVNRGGGFVQNEHGGRTSPMKAA